MNFDGDVYERIGEYRKDAEVKRGLCPSCLDSGYVHETRRGEIGVVKDRNGGLIRCECSSERRGGAPSYRSVREAEEKALERM